MILPALIAWCEIRSTHPGWKTVCHAMKHLRESHSVNDTGSDTVKHIRDILWNSSERYYETPQRDTMKQLREILTNSSGCGILYGVKLSVSHLCTKTPGGFTIQKTILNNINKPSQQITTGRCETYIVYGVKLSVCHICVSHTQCVTYTKHMADQCTMVVSQCVRTIKTFHSCKQLEGTILERGH